MISVSSKVIIDKLSIAPKDPATKYRVAFSFMFILPLLICAYVGINYILKVEMPNTQVYGLIALGISMSIVGLYLSYNTSVREVVVEESQEHISQSSDSEGIKTEETNKREKS